MFLEDTYANDRNLRSSGIRKSRLICWNIDASMGYGKYYDSYESGYVVIGKERKFDSWSRNVTTPRDDRHVTRMALMDRSAASWVFAHQGKQCYRCGIVCFNGSTASAAQVTAYTNSYTEVTFDPEPSMPQAIVESWVQNNGVWIGTRSRLVMSFDLIWPVHVWWPV